MDRPIEYENLIRTRSFKAAVSDRGSIEQFMRMAEVLQEDASGPLRDATRFVLCYEGMFNVVMAVLEFREVRPGDGAGHRATAIARVAADLQLDAPMQSVLARMHDVRNRVTYRDPIPPVTKADSTAMQAILARMLPAAKSLIGLD